MKDLELPDKFPLTLAVKGVWWILPPDTETQMLMGAAPSKPTAPVAMNFLPPEVGEKAYSKW